MPRSQIKDEDTYKALRREGASEEKAARIANARAAGTLHHGGGKLEGRSKEELYDEARRIGIKGRAEMTKAELVDAIRNHR